MYASPSACSLATKRVRGDLEVLLDRQLRKQPTALRHDRHAGGTNPLGAIVGQVRAVEVDPALRHPCQTGTRQRKARLAGAVRPEKRGDLARWNLDRDVVDNVARPAGDRHAVDRERAHSATSSVPRYAFITFRSRSTSASGPMPTADRSRARPSSRSTPEPGSCRGRRGSRWRRCARGCCG